MKCVKYMYAIVAAKFQCEFVLNSKIILHKKGY